MIRLSSAWRAAIRSAALAEIPRARTPSRPAGRRSVRIHTWAMPASANGSGTTVKPARAYTRVASAYGLRLKGPLEHTTHPPSARAVRDAVARRDLHRPGLRRHGYPWAK